MGLDSRRLNRRQQAAPGAARIRGAALLHGDSSRGSMCFPGEVWGGAFFKKAASPAFPARPVKICDKRGFVQFFS